MPILTSAAPRAFLAGVLILALTGCASLGAGPPSPDVSAPPLVSGGGTVSSDQGGHEAQPPEPAESSPGEASSSEGESGPSLEETPSFSELPSSVSSVAPPPPSSPSSSSASPAASSGVSSAPASSSQPVSSGVPSSSSLPDPDEEDEDDEEDDEPDEPVTVQPSRPASSSQTSSPAPEPEPEEDPDEEDDSPSTSGWMDLRVQSGGATVSGSGLSIVAQIVENEIGHSYPDEAIKAQAVAAYTFVRYHNATGSAPAVGLRDATDRVTRLVREVAGEQITYNGSPILASYCAMSAGWTASSRSVWGRPLPYLVPVDSDVDERESGFLRTTTFSAGQVQSKLESALGVDLDGVDPDDWFDVLSYWDDTGLYVNEVRIGGQATTTGRRLRENILGLRSAAFEVRYDPGAEQFAFLTRGYGHGVGMSQVGAKHLANDGWDHIEILEHYYTGAEVTGG